MIQHLRPALLLLVILTALTGIGYPLVVTGVASAAFPDAAHGALIVVQGRVAGSQWIGQWFDDPKYFWPRPSATSPGPYNAASSSGESCCRVCASASVL